MPALGVPESLIPLRLLLSTRALKSPPEMVWFARSRRQSVLREQLSPTCSSSASDPGTVCRARRRCLCTTA